jgi:hypothetical protein
MPFGYTLSPVQRPVFFPGHEANTPTAVANPISPLLSSVAQKSALHAGISTPEFPGSCISPPHSIDTRAQNGTHVHNNMHGASPEVNDAHVLSGNNPFEPHTDEPHAYMANSYSHPQNYFANTDGASNGGNAPTAVGQQHATSYQDPSNPFSNAPRVEPAHSNSNTMAMKSTGHDTATRTSPATAGNGQISPGQNSVGADMGHTWGFNGHVSSTPVPNSMTTSTVSTSGHAAGEGLTGLWSEWGEGRVGSDMFSGVGIV